MIILHVMTNMKNSAAPSLKVLKPMLIANKFLAIFPPYTFGKQSTSLSIYYKIYNVLFTVFLISAYIYHVYGKLTCDKFESWDSTLNVVDYISNFLLMAVSIATCILTLRNYNRLQCFLYSLEQFDKTTKKPYKEKKQFETMAPTLKCFTLTIIIIDSITYSRAITMEVYKYYLVRSIFWYHFCESLFFKFWMSHEILFRFQYLNQLLTKAVSKHKATYFEHGIITPNFQVKTVESARKDTIRLRNFSCWFDDLCNIVDNYNEVFGPILLGSVLYNISFIMQGVVVVLVGVVFKKEDNLKATDRKSVV